MESVAIELNDAGLAVVSGGAVLLSEPGYAAMADGELLFGHEARKVARLHPRQTYRRFWRDLDDRALAQPVDQFKTGADLVHAHLQRLWSRCPPGCESVVLAVPAYWTPAQLGLLLGICREIGLPASGLVDNAIAASRRPHPGRDVWNIEASLYTIDLTRIEQNDGASLGTRHLLQQIGIEALERACAEFIARRFVETSRFDPLHAAGSEQSLYDSLGEWLGGLSRKESLEPGLEYRGQIFSASISSAGLKEIVNRACQPLIQKLRALLPARGAVVLQIDHRLIEFPGLLEDLSRLPGCLVVALEPAAAARGALRWRGKAAEPGTARLVTDLPWDQAPADPSDLRSGPGDPGSNSIPTHVLFADRAYRLGPVPFQIGTDLADGEYGVILGGRVPAVSRRHCTVRVEDGRVLVHDQSRFGTLLNGHRIDSVAVLQAGDVLGVGQPPQEFQLVAEVTNDGA